MAKTFNIALSLAVILQHLGPGTCQAKSALIAMSEDIRGICQQAEQLINNRQFNQAIQLLNRANGIDPNCPEVHGYLGMAYQNSLNTRQAIEEYRKALTLNPQMSFINVNLGTCYMNENQPEQALPYFQRYLQDNPNAPDAAQVQAYIQQSGSRKGEQNLRALIEQGQALLNQHRNVEARRAFEQAIAQQPNFAPAHFYLAYALAQAGQNQSAIDQFQTSLQLDPSLKEALLNIGSNYQSLGDSAQAITWYEKYLAENPNSPRCSEIRQRVKGLHQQMNKSGPQSARAPSTPQAVPSLPQAKAQIPSPPLTPSVNDYLANAASDGKLFRWARMPIRVYIAPGAGTAGYRDSYYQVLLDAFSKWAQASENRILFTLVNDPGQSDIACSWTSDANKIVQGGKAVEGGITRLSGQPQANADVSLTSARVIILTERNGAPLSDDDMKKNCLHELGHALGINGHSPNNRDVMFFSESEAIWPSLTIRDKTTIRKLYGDYPKLSTGN